MSYFPAQSVVRVTFNDKRLQYAEQEQLEEWRTSRPGERLIKIDVPLSYNIVEYSMNPHTLNSVEFLWDPKQIVGCFVQVRYENHFNSNIVSMYPK